MSQQLPHFSAQGDIHVDAPIMGKIVVVGHGNQTIIQLQVRGAKDATLQLDPQDPLVQSLLQVLAYGSAQANVLTSNGLHPTIAAPSLRAEDLGPSSPFSSPLGIPAPFSGDADQLARNFASLDGFLRQLDQQFGGTLSHMTNGQQSLNLSDLLLQKGNLALWRFRQGALRLFAEQTSLYALAETQNLPPLGFETFQVAARNNLDVRRGWVLFQKYCTYQPTLIDQGVIEALTQGRWQAVLDAWSAGQRLPSEQVQAERQYLSAMGERYDAQAVQTAAREAEWYFTQALQRQPGQSTALVNLGALLAESALLAYIETGRADRARLQEVQNLFQQAHALLAQRPDREGRIALAQCLLYEATCLPPDAHLGMVGWAANQAQQLHAALGRNAPGTMQWDIVQRNLARRDPRFIDRTKIEMARDILIGAAAAAILITLAEQWLSAHTRTVEQIKHLPGHHLLPNHLEHPSGSVSNHATSMHTPAVHHTIAPHAIRAASKGVVHKVLGTTAGKIIAGVVVTAVIAATIVVVVHRPSAGKINEFATPGGGPVWITSGPDGNLWFTEMSSNRIGRITPAGAIAEFPVPTSGSQPFGIAAGPDGNLWFTELAGNQIGRITPTGSITEFPVPTSGSQPGELAVGPDGNLWFTETSFSANKIGRITPLGNVTEFLIPTPGSGPFDIAKGPDNNLWFTEIVEKSNDPFTHKIGRITTSGTITEFLVPSGGIPYGIVAGPDGNLWFTDSNTISTVNDGSTLPGGNKIGRITTSGVITEFLLPTPRSWPFGITTGPDGNLWFTESDGNKIGRISPSGTITEFSLPTSGSAPYAIAAGPDGNLWFSEAYGGKIGQITT